MIGGHWAGSQVAWYVQRCFRLKLQKHFSSYYSWRKKACKNAVLNKSVGCFDSHRCAILCTRGVLVVPIALAVAGAIKAFFSPWRKRRLNVMFYSIYQTDKGLNSFLPCTEWEMGNGSSRLTYNLSLRFKNARYVLVDGSSQ